SDRLAKVFPVIRWIRTLSGRPIISRPNSPILIGVIQRTSQLTLCVQRAHLNSVSRLYLIGSVFENVFRSPKSSGLTTDLPGISFLSDRPCCSTERKFSFPRRNYDRGNHRRRDCGSARRHHRFVFLEEKTRLRLPLLGDRVFSWETAV